MNYVKASCGHLVVAVGTPGSSARELVEKNLCDNCKDHPIRRLIEAARECGDQRLVEVVADAEKWMAMNP